MTKEPTLAHLKRCPGIKYMGAGVSAETGVISPDDRIATCGVSPKRPTAVKPKPPSAPPPKKPD